jgi:hypothetical protein
MQLARDVLGSTPRRAIIDLTMHEAGVTERILEIVIEQAAQAGAECVTDVYLEVGDASGIDAESVALHWSLLSPGTVAEGAELHVEAAADPFAFRPASIEVDEPARRPRSPARRRAGATGG